MAHPQPNQSPKNFKQYSKLAQYKIKNKYDPTNKSINMAKDNDEEHLEFERDDGCVVFS